MTNQSPSPTNMIETPDGGCVMAMFRHLEEGADGFDLRMIAIAHGFDATWVKFNETNTDDDLTRRYESGDQVVADWHPPPADGYSLAAKFDTEDGPVAWFIRPVTEKPSPHGHRLRLGARAGLARAILHSHHAFDPKANSAAATNAKALAFMVLLQAHGGCPQKLADAWGRLLWQADHPPGTDPDSTLAADMGNGWTMERDLALDWELNAPAFRRLAAGIIRDLAKEAGYELKGNPA